MLQGTPTAIVGYHVYMGLSSDFESELRAIDVALSGGVRARIGQLEAEIQALLPRLSVARAQRIPVLVQKIESLIVERQNDLKTLKSYREILSGEPELPPDLVEADRRRAQLVTPITTPKVNALAPNVPTMRPVPPQAVLPAAPVPQTPKGPFAVAVKRRHLRATDAEVVEPMFEDVKSQPSEPAPIPPKAKPTITRTQFLKLQTAFGQMERAFFEDPSWSSAKEARLKGLVCDARALIGWCHELDLDESHLVTSLRILRDEFNDRTDFGSFFAFNEGRIHRPSVWRELGEAFEALSVGIECLDWLESVNLGETERLELVRLAGATEAWLHRLNDEHGLGFVDELQRDVHRRVESLASDTYVPYWASQGAGRMLLADVAKAAKSLSIALGDVRKRLESAENKDRALEALGDLAKSIQNDGAIEDTIIPAIRKCLDLGIPPSRKDLLGLCLPYRALIKDVDEKAFARLNDYLSREESRMAARREVPIDPEEPIDLELTMRLTAVQNYVKGKTLLFIGGRRIPEKKREVESVLGIKELLWPDADPDTLLHDFTAHALKADIVCYLIRWSRHSYKRVVDLAKSEGKEIVVIKAGVGVNRLVHDVYDQLVRHTEGESIEASA